MPCGLFLLTGERPHNQFHQRLKPSTLSGTSSLIKVNQFMDALDVALDFALTPAGRAAEYVGQTHPRKFEGKLMRSWRLS